MRTIVLALVTMFSILPVYAQQSNRTVTGTVVTTGGEAVAGASVVVKGTLILVNSDESGRFEIETPADAILVVSLSGYQREEIPVRNRTNIKVTLVEEGEEEQWVAPSKDKRAKQADVELPSDEKESKGGVVSKVKSLFSKSEDNSADNEERLAEAETYYQKGEKARDDELYELAIEYYAKCIRLNPKHDRAHFWMGDCYWELKQYKKAIACYKQSLKYNPDDHIAYYWIGYCYYKLKEYKAGIEFLQKASDLDPDDKYSYNILGHCFYNLKNYKRALLCYQKALEIDPDYAAAREGLQLCRKRL